MKKKHKANPITKENERGFLTQEYLDTLGPLERKKALRANLAERTRKKNAEATKASKPKRKTGFFSDAELKRSAPVKKKPLKKTARPKKQKRKGFFD
jgi:hypothetical protein